MLLIYKHYKKNHPSSQKPSRSSNSSVHPVSRLSNSTQGVNTTNTEINTESGNHTDDNPPSKTTRLSPESLVDSKKKKQDARVYRWKLFGALLLPYFIASLDLTIVATALPFIASAFDKFEQLNWIVTAFTLTSTAFTLAFGQLADLLGRHLVIQSAMVLMIIGSTLCAAAQDWGMLLLGRAMQGVSAAGIQNIIYIILADKVSLKEYAKNNTIFVFVSGASFSVGPVIGGYLTAANWRYCFVLPIPLSVISSVLIYLLLRDELIEGTHFQKGSRWSSLLPAFATLDLGGIILFIFGVGLIILGTAWGGSTYPWASVQILVPVVIGGICLAGFIAYESLLEPGRIMSRIFPRQLPLVPFHLFRKLDTSILFVLQFAAGTAMYSVFYFIGIYFTLVEAFPASEAGVQLLYYIPGLGAGVYLAMFMCNIWPAQTWHPLALSAVIETAGLAALSWAVQTRKSSVVKGMMGLAGAGTGMRLMPGSLHTVGIWPEQIATSMSLMRFALPFGGTLGLTIMGAVFNNKLTEFGGSIPSSGGPFSVHNLQSLDSIDSLPAAVQDVIRAAGAHAVKWSFIAIMPILGLSCVAVLFLGNVWIKTKMSSKDDEQQAQQTQTVPGLPVHTSTEPAAENPRSESDLQASEVIHVPYLYALFSGKMSSFKRISQPLSEAGKRKQAEVVRERIGQRLVGGK